MHCIFFLSAIPDQLVALLHRTVMVRYFGSISNWGQRLNWLLFRPLSSYRHYKCSESKKEVESSPGMRGEPFVLLLNQSIKWFFRWYQQNSFSSSWQTLWSTFNQTPETSNRTSITTWMMPLQSFPNCKQVSMSTLGNSFLKCSVVWYYWIILFVLILERWY